MPNVWTIHNETGGPTKSSLHGCHIKVNDAGTAYEFVKGGNVYSTATNNGSLPTTPFSFAGFGFDNFTWTVNVTTLTGGASGNQALGNWSNNAPNIAGDQGGEFTAQAGSGVGVDGCEDSEEDSSAASA